ncbi:hypothetical protein AUC70_05900 [Methyloceanibacter stevinii]|uniref:JAB domain-containing protein n=1 Tax=Methyloceanibacter stevinii TaxID=1774970 RepID=A0A1E3VNV9_9HYPH|nr:hypothetical protein AUC70_05900 [Methyloceanibacter stevinii]
MKAVAQSPVEAEAVRAISMQAAEVHLEFDRDLATQLAGRKKADDRKAVLVGAGSIGSHVSDCLIREGRFRWTVIDPDILLPHNIGRHIFRAPEATKFKANLLAKALSDTLDGDPDNADAITDNVLAQGEVGEKIREALAEAEVIIDATASILAERFLSDNPSQARRISIFFNPLGDAGVLLSEPADRNLSLRDLEAQYLGWLVRKEEFADHLESSGGDYAYTGACRAITNLTSPANVTVLSGLIATGVGSALDEDAGAIRIWKLHDGGNVTAHTYAPEPVLSFSAMAWMVTIDSGLLDRILVLRAERLPVETGGVLLGTVDIPSKRIHVIEALPAPPDSVETRHGFTRGTQGVQDALDNVWERTRGQVRYVGEWHSHPPRSAPLPSAIDLVQIDWLSTLFDMETLPALMLIAADDSLSVILANSEAAPITPDAGTEPTPAGANA